MASVVKRYADRYLDSVMLLAATRAMGEGAGVTWATAVMATPANVEALVAEGFDDTTLATAGANDVVLAVRADDEIHAADALALGDHALFATSVVVPRAQSRSRSLDAALTSMPHANVAIVSVPGPYAAVEAHKALTAGLDVLLFSDNVSVDEEIELKDHAAVVGHLLMGPGAGTAVLGGCGLGFANVVRRGRVGVVAAAGTGAQEMMALLDLWGEGVSQVIGVGGRDLSVDVGGRMARMAVRALDHDVDTEIIVLVSKPPSADVARAVVNEARRAPVVACLVGLPDGTEVPGAAAVSSSLEGGAAAVMRLLGRPAPIPHDPWRAMVDETIARMTKDRTLVRGLFSGGTLCYEALTLMQPWLGPVWSNTPLDHRYRVPAPAGHHICLDLGEEEHTRGRPHPMIDPAARIELLRQIADDADVAVVLLDVVLGYGAHVDPAAQLAPVCAELVASDGPAVVVYVLGTSGDPQDLGHQQQTFRAAGCLVAPTAARAALAAAAIAARRPEIVETAL